MKLVGVLKMTDKINYLSGVVQAQTTLLKANDQMLALLEKHCDSGIFESDIYKEIRDRNKRVIDSIDMDYENG